MASPLISSHPSRPQESQPSLFDFTPQPASQRSVGQAAKDAALAALLERVGDAWRRDCLARLRDFCALRRFEGKAVFRMEEFRAFALAWGLPEPHTHHVWGVVPQLAVRARLIEWTGGYQQAESARTHGHPVKVWRAL